MEFVLSLIAAEEPPIQQDSLTAFIKSRGGTKSTQDALRNGVSGVDWTTLVAVSKTKAESIVAGVQKKASQEGTAMDDNTRQMVFKMALREAIGRQLEMVFTRNESMLSSTSTNESIGEIASPYADGARFDQIPQQTMETLIQLGIGVIPQFMSKEWDIACVADAERAVRTNSLITHATAQESHRWLLLNPQKHVAKFPAVISIAELLAALPRELNLKLRSRFCEVNGEVWLWSNAFALPPPVVTLGSNRTRMLAGYVFCTDSKQRTVKVRVHDRELEIPTNAVLLSKIPEPFTPRLKTSPDSAWMVCVTFNEI